MTAICRIQPHFQWTGACDAAVEKCTYNGTNSAITVFKRTNACNGF